MSKNTKDASWNPVAYHLHNACESSANSIDSYAVGVSVAVEALASLIQLEQDKAATEQVSAFQTRVHGCLATMTDAAENLLKRMRGLIDMMSQGGPKDALHALAKTGHVEKAYVGAWAYLRNRHVHPKLKDLERPTQADYQKLIDHIHQVEVLLYQITFYLCGYEGHFSDYGVHGGQTFPSKSYPLVPGPSVSDLENS